MAWRSPHGNKAKLGATGVTWETAHQDPAPKVPDGVGIEIARDKGGRVRSTEDARRLAQLRRAPNFVPRDVPCREDFKPYNNTRRKLTRERLTELHQQTGGASRGVGARVRAACWGFAFGEYLASKAAETGDPELMDRAMSVLAKASTEDEKARRLAADEAQARPRASAADRVTAAIIGRRPTE